jgi:hypothetical protein
MLIIGIDTVPGDLPARRVEAVEAVVDGADPQQPLAVPVLCGDLAAAQTVGTPGVAAVVRHLSGTRIEPVQPLVGRADPEVPPAILQEAVPVRSAAAQAVRIGWIVSVVRQGLGPRVEPVDPHPGDGEPQHPAAAGDQHGYLVAGEAVGCAALEPERPEGVPVVAVQALRVANQRKPCSSWATPPTSPEASSASLVSAVNARSCPVVTVRVSRPATASADAPRGQGDADEHQRRGGQHRDDGAERPGAPPGAGGRARSCSRSR